MYIYKVCFKKSFFFLIKKRKKERMIVKIVKIYLGLSLVLLWVLWGQFIFS